MNKALTVFIVVLIGLALNLPAQNLVITSPNGGETLTLGQAVQITWTASNASQKVKLQLIKGGGALVGVIAANLNATPGTFTWTVGQYQGGIAEAGSNYKIRVRLQDGDSEDASNGVFAIVAGASTQSPAPPAPPAPPGGLNVIQGQSGLQTKPLKVNAQLVNYAVITSYTVDGKTDLSGNKVDCHLPLGMQCQVGVFSKTQPVLYRYKLIIYEQISGMTHVVKLSPWLEQNSYKVLASLQEVTDAAFPGGMSSTMPFSVFGAVGVEVKNTTQTEQPQARSIQIKLYLQ